MTGCDGESGPRGPLSLFRTGMGFRRTDCLLQVGNEKATPPDSISRGMAMRMCGHCPKPAAAERRDAVQIPFQRFSSPVFADAVFLRTSQASTSFPLASSFLKAPGMTGLGVPGTLAGRFEIYSFRCSFDRWAITCRCSSRGSQSIASTSRLPSSFKGITINFIFCCSYSK